MKKILISLIVLLLLVLLFWIAGQSDWHTDRNKHNRLPTGDLVCVASTIYQDDTGLNWELQPHIKNRFHQPDEEVEATDNPYGNLQYALPFDSKNPNLKFLAESDSGGSYEAILQPNGKYLTTGPKLGTYNYGHPSGLYGSLKHVLYDVLPHFANGNYK